MPEFNENDHPRGHVTGRTRFAERTHSEPDAVLTDTELTIDAAREQLRIASDEAGLGGIMPPVFDVIFDREVISPQALARLDYSAINDLYESEIAPGIDQVEEKAQWLGLDDYTELADPTEHIQKISDEAGLGGIMPEVFGVLMDRENVSYGQLHQMTADHVTALYEVFEPSIDCAIRQLQ